MAIFRFLRTPKPQRFDYKPQYWDPEKEEREERIRQLKGEEDLSADAMKGRISRSFHGHSRGAGQMRHRTTRRSNVIFLAVFIFLVIFTYYIIVRYLTQIVDALE